MFHERDCLQGRIPDGKDYLRQDSNNPEHPKLQSKYTMHFARWFISIRIEFRS